MWAWTINNDFSLEFGHLIDPLTSIMLILITTVGSDVLQTIRIFMSFEHVSVFVIRVILFITLLLVF